MNDVPPVPTATYRLQLGPHLDFAGAAALVPYLAALGVSHCYFSPYLKARAGSPHGYDIVDHNALAPELGDWDAFQALVDTLRQHGMGQVLDLVVNHMGVGGNDNAWWLDTLEHGPASRYAPYFDIAWHPVNTTLRDKVLLPFLEAQYGQVLEQGKLGLALDPAAGTLAVHYYEHRFPIDPRTYPQVLGQGMAHLETALGREDPDLMELQSLINGFGKLPQRTAASPEAREERRRDAQVLKRRLAELMAEVPAIAEHLATQVAATNGTPGEPASFDALHALLEDQAYRLANWRTAADEINYRRFFDINDLAGLRMEHPPAFADTHRLVLELLAGGLLDGLRIDHPDGLYDPAGYYARLRLAHGEVCGGIGNRGQARPCYLVVEKILAPYEHLREDWPVHGTTGYDFANLVGGLLLHPHGEGPLTRIHARFTGRGEPFEEVAYACKRLITQVQLSSELTVLASLLNDLSEADRHTRDFTLNGLREALREVVACFPVYRTYITEQGASEEDRRYVDWAVAQAKRRSPAADLAVFDFIRRVLLLEGFDRDGALRARALRFAMRFQQYTAPVLAKGVEDTAFYRYTRLIALNEVGGEPSRFGVSLAACHHANAQRARHWPHAMLTLATHDSKRSGDVRARLAVLSELSGEWRAAVARWRRLARHRRRKADERPAPTANDEYLLYQTLVGIWPMLGDAVQDPEGNPILTERVEGFVLKALREAKELTSWINPNEDYEQAVTAFVRRLLAEPAGRRLRADLDGFARRIAYFGALNTLSQTLLHLTAPGVPDLYQGSEALAFHLVDPDNRRPLDFAALQRSLDALREREPDPRGLLQDLHDGRAKQYLTWRTLTLRRRLPGVFLDGDYLPLTAQGQRAEHVCAYARRHGESTVIAVAPRWPATLSDGRETPPLGEVWEDTHLPLPDGTHTLRDALTGATTSAPGPLRLSELLADFPVALLVDECGVPISLLKTGLSERPSR